MAELKERKDDVNVAKLKSLHFSSPPFGLNTALRNELEAFAASNKSTFAQDNVGNIYITRPGTDPSLSGIALTFQLDSPSSPHDSFSGALHTYLDLLPTKTKCDICLLGWSSPRQSSIGRDVWEEEVSVDEAYEQFPELKRLNGLHDVSEFGCSALLEIGEVEGARLEVRGSPLLVEKARIYLPADGSVGGEGPSSSRCPVLSLCGDGAEGVAKGVEIGRAHV